MPRLIMALVLCGTLAEGVLVLNGFSAPITSRRDDLLGWSYRPNLSSTQKNEGFAHIETNSFGYRYDE